MSATTETGASRLNKYLQGKGQLTSLSWIESWTGLSHAKTWTMICKINGEVRGQGVSTHKHIAKDLAADAAWDALNAEDARNAKGAVNAEGTPNAEDDLNAEAA